MIKIRKHHTIAERSTPRHPSSQTTDGHADAMPIYQLCPEPRRGPDNSHNVTTPTLISLQASSFIPRCPRPFHTRTARPHMTSQQKRRHKRYAYEASFAVTPASGHFASVSLNWGEYLVDRDGQHKECHEAWQRTANTCTLATRTEFDRRHKSDRRSGSELACGPTPLPLPLLLPSSPLLRRVKRLRGMEARILEVFRHRILRSESIEARTDGEGHSG